MLEPDTGMQVDTEDNLQLIYHFACIQNLSRLLIARVTNYDKHTWFCNNCLNHFKLRISFENRQCDFMSINKVKMILPNKEKKMSSIKNYRHKEAVLFAVYADFE